MKYKVREAKHSDIAKLTGLRVKQLEERVTDLKPEVALSTMRHLTDELGSRVRVWVAELDGEVIGCAFVHVNRSHCRLRTVVDLRGREFGYIKVDVDEQQENFFRRIGFSRHGRELRLRYNR